MEQEKVISPFNDLKNAIEDANINAIDKTKIYDALARYIEHDVEILNNLTNTTWNAKQKQ
jgi:hypothetical protein